jgi:hypothetical protein
MLPETHKEEVNGQISKLLDEEITAPSRSAFSSTLLLVPKKEKVKWRLVTDFRKLNEWTIGDTYPLPKITDILDQLGKAQFFSTVKLSSGYYQVELAEKGGAKTTFNTPGGHFEFFRLPMGLKSSPSAFQSLTNSVLAGMNGFTMFCYMDTNKQTPWSESASELYRPSNRRLSAKSLPTLTDKGCHVVSVTDP